MHVHPRLYMFLGSFSYLIVQLTYGFVFALYTPLMTSFRLPKYLTPILWAIGPICGLLQPLWGWLSDRCTFRWGRRRPFVFLGSFLIICTYLLFAFCKKLGHAMGDHGDRHTASIIIAIFAMTMVNISVNIVMVIARSLVNDLSPQHDEAVESDATEKNNFEKTMGNLFISIMIGLGNMASNLSVFFSKNAGQSFVIGIILVVVTLIPLFFAKEPRPEKRTPNGSIQDPLLKEEEKSINGDAYYQPTATPRRKGVLRSILTTPIIFSACMIFFLSWASYFPFSTNATQFVGENVYNGTSSVANHTVPVHPHHHNWAPTISSSFSPYVPPPTMLAGLPPSMAAPLMFMNALQGSKKPMTPLERFNHGKKMGALGIAAQAIMVCLFSLMCNWKKLMAGVAKRYVYMVTQILATGGYLMLFWTDRLWMMFVAFVLIGPNFALFNSIPFAIVQENTPKDQGGAFAGAMNYFCVAAQLLSLGINSLCQAVFAKYVHPLRFVMVFSAGLSGIATLFSFAFIFVGKKKKEDRLLGGEDVFN
eukprot:gnl/Trimastix_PCT/1269.p1 GENE.gnl/Trimastix_PCT/1269~~gnl/Trimastix_PCT/1269.p1  ORF type:complete len:561 (-),score=154.22 gnl/Trimastix_PCT/1269:191-1792(-)